VETLFDAVGIPYTESDTILRQLWNKLMLNTGINQVVMVYEGTYATVQQPGEARNLMIATMEEVMRVANAEGIDLNQGDIQNWLQVADGLNPNGMPSMRQDGLAKRYSEVELFSGTILPLAQKHQIAVPNCAALYQRIKMMEAAY
jgi:2-dehydropantoate 2-reductase